ncbi:hypothetical protein Vi05172_g5034 [Venturia inaequalis]|uniref:Galactose oxidase n=2 Tax=Venturia inaequalis TaxID=5025 RepID=A0A8H3V6D6_VENIN|nr:hypothetical protein EG327_006219 [Venturia inaequalis]RDI84898.1 hypothetical protein Vi05172_g5034 [Venturia inaequalis]
MLTCMILGVVGYPSSRSSRDLSQESSFKEKLSHFVKSKSTASLHDSDQNHQPAAPRDGKAHFGATTRHSSAATRVSSDQESQSSFRLLPTFSFENLPSPTKPRLKHVPIVVPRYVPLAPDSPHTSIEFSPRTSADSRYSDYSPVDSEISLSGRKLSFASSDSSGSKPRHVEIKIPDWAQPTTSPESPIKPSIRNSIFNSSPIRLRKSISSSVMMRGTPGTSRTSTMDSTTSIPTASQLQSDRNQGGSNLYLSETNGSHSNLYRGDHTDREAQSRTPASGYGSAPPTAAQQTASLATPSSSNSGLSGLVCNVHRTTGREPRPLVGATTTILGDKLYVFGGRKLSRSRPQLTNDLYELDLIRRHWTKVESTGDKPPARYFHSVCALGDTKLVCYGGMSPATLPNGQPTIPNQPVNPQDPQPEVVVMSDIHIYDVTTRSWQKVPSSDSPQGRYAHCASILPSSSIFPSADAVYSAIHHNPSSAQAPNTGQLGVELDGSGGAEMVVVGGQDSANHYIEQISVFNLRSLKWTATSVLGRSCGAYRSVTAPLSAAVASKIGTAVEDTDDMTGEQNEPPPDSGSALLIYSNYNFLDVKLELQLRLPDGTLIEKDMEGTYTPPGLRFPNGGVIDNHFVVSGTFLTSSKQEYALWALDLRNLTWSRIDAGASTFSQGSWNRGVLWSRRNTFVILGNRRRSLVEDYNHRRINFANLCMVELEAFGLYDNPRKRAPTSDFVSASYSIRQPTPDPYSGGRQLSRAAEDLGQMAMGLSELSDMDFIAMDGERIPANSHIVARRWGPYFKQLLIDGMASTDANDTATLRPTLSSLSSRQSSLTITPSMHSTLNGSNPDGYPNGRASFDFINVNPAIRPRALYLPHTRLTIQALLHYLYTSSVPPTSSTLCTPQILCSLLQLARPYKIDGLLEAVVERLHHVLDNRNTAAIFNAAAMAAGGGEGVLFYNRGLAHGDFYDLLNGGDRHDQNGTGAGTGTLSIDYSTDGGVSSRTSQALRNLRIDTETSHRRPSTAMSTGGASASEDDVSSVGTEPLSERAGSINGTSRGDGEVWSGELSSVVGLQKRGLRGLMEGRRIREQYREGGGDSGRVGLGIV